MATERVIALVVEALVGRPVCGAEIPAEPHGTHVCADSPRHASVHRCYDCGVLWGEDGVIIGWNDATDTTDTRGF